MLRWWWIKRTARWRCGAWGDDRGPFVFDQCIRWRGHDDDHFSRFGRSFRGDELWPWAPR